MIKAIIQEDQNQREADVGYTIESVLTSNMPLIQEAWICMRGWYKDTLDRPPPPTRVAISTMTAESVDLYQNVLPSGQPIPMGVQPFPMENSIPEDKESAWAVHRFCRKYLGSPLEMRAEHLRQWLIPATRGDTPDATNWLKVLPIAQAVLRDGTMANDCTWQTVVLIPKGSIGDFRGIRLVKVLWKTVTSLLNFRLMTDIKLTMCCTGKGRAGGRGPLPS